MSVDTRWLRQTSFVPKEGDPAATGNCLQACLASVLARHLEDVPNFAAIEGDESEWFLEMDAWLRARGMGVAVMFTEDAAPWYVTEGTYGLAHGKSPRGNWNHTVVVQAGSKTWEVVHDPHPSDAGLDGMAKEIWILYRLDPAG